MFDVSSRAKLSVSALAERKIASARPRKYGLLLRAEEEMLLYGQALDDRFHETGLDEASIHGTGIMFVDSSFEKS
jgi:hypothetical protein